MLMWLAGEYLRFLLKALEEYLKPLEEYLKPLLAKALEQYLKPPELSSVVDKSKEWAASVLTPFDYDSIAESVNLKNALAEPLPLKIPISSVLYKKLEPLIAEHFISNDVYKADTISSHVTLFMDQVLHSGSESLLGTNWDMIFGMLWNSLLHLTERDMIRIIGVALAGGEMCVWTMKKGCCVLDTLCGPVQMRYPGSRYKCILVSVNLLRIALTLKNVFLKLPFMPRPWTTLPLRTYGELGNLTRKINIIWPNVTKRIKPWSSHVAEGFTTWKYVNSAYSLNVPQLINGECVLSRNDGYKVTLQEVGYEEESISEYAMREAIKDVLHALKALHAAGLVHRDVRWKNILRKNGGGWMLIDLETVWKSGEKPKCRLQAWDGKTLDDGKYTEKSDLYLVGKLMQKLPHTGHSLRRQLLNRAYNCAEDALEDDWLDEQ